MVPFVSIQKDLQIDKSTLPDILEDFLSRYHVRPSLPGHRERHRRHHNLRGKHGGGVMVYTSERPDSTS